MEETNPTRKDNGQPQNAAIGLQILYYPAQGRCELNGPLENLPLLLGMLEMAKVIVMDMRYAEKQKPLIEVPRLVTLPKAKES